MESIAANGVDSSSKAQNLASVIGNKPPSSRLSTPRSSQPPSPKQSRNRKNVYKMTPDNNKQQDELPNMAKEFYDLNGGKLEYMGTVNVLDTPVETSSEKRVLTVETESCGKPPVDNGPEITNLTDLLESESIVSAPCKEGVGQSENHLALQLAINSCPSPSNSMYTTASLYAEAKQSFTTEVSECATSIGKSAESGEVSQSCDLLESRKTSVYRGSTRSDVSDESSSSSLSSTIYKPHMANDSRWEAIQVIRQREASIGVTTVVILLVQFHHLSNISIGSEMV